MMDEYSQEQEMALAYEQKRQPNCVYCKKPLDEVRQLQDEEIVWRWDKKLNQYMKSEEGSANKPYHPACDSADWGYIDEKLIAF
jgi:hypothetical protein